MEVWARASDFLQVRLLGFWGRRGSGFLIGTRVKVSVRDLHK